MRATPIERFFTKVRITPGCWIWNGAKRKKGYGMIGIAGKTLSAHRFSYQIHVGEIPSGSLVCHRCDNPQCVNPDHLFLGSEEDNLRDKMQKGRQAKGERMGSARLSEQDVRMIRKIYIKRSKEFNLRKVAEMFGVSAVHVLNIVNMKKWAHCQ